MMTLLKTALAASALVVTLAPALPASAETVLRLVPQADLKILDTTWTNALITRNYGLMVYDTLFSLDSKLQPKPELVQSWTRSPDGMLWTFTLRPGMKFQDGTPITAADAVQSLKRWGARRVDGIAMMAAADGLTVKDDLTFELKFKTAFGPVLETLANPILPTFVLRAKDTTGDPFTQQDYDTVVGSGPFTFDKKEWVPGAKVVFRKWAGYQPRPEPADGFAGGKVVKVDTVEWLILPDAAVALQALQRGEVDVIDSPQIDLLPIVQSDPGVQVVTLDKLGWQGIIRPNALFPPFDNPKARQALMMAIDQNNYLAAIAGDQPLKRPCLAIFICGSPNETLVGSEPFAKRDLSHAKALLKESGYNGEKVVLMGPSDFPALTAIANVLAQDMREMGINLDFQIMDWGTLSTRQQRKDKPGPGSPGWNVYVTGGPGLLFFNPLTNFAMATPCDGKNWNGWTCDLDLEAKRVAFAQATTPAERMASIEAIQRRYYEVMPFLNAGQFLWPKVVRKTITGLGDGPDLVLWNVEKHGT